MGKSKKSIRPFIIAFAVVVLIAASTTVFYKTGSDVAISMPEKKSTPEKKKVASYLDLNLNDEGLLKDQVMDLESHSPNIPEFDSKTTFASSTPQQDIVLQKEFLEASGSDYARSHTLFSKRYTPIIVDVSGEIGNIPLVDQSSSLKHVRFDAKTDTKAFLVTFSTRLNHETGHIFWHRITKSSGKSKVDKLATGVLKSLQFEKDFSSYVSRGDVTLVLHLEKGINFHKKLTAKLTQLEDITFNPRIGNVMLQTQ